MIDCSQLSLGDAAIGMNSAVIGFVHFRHTESESPALATSSQQAFLFKQSFRPRK